MSKRGDLRSAIYDQLYDLVTTYKQRKLPCDDSEWVNIYTGSDSGQETIGSCLPVEQEIQIEVRTLSKDNAAERNDEITEAVIDRMVSNFTELQYSGSAIEHEADGEYELIVRTLNYTAGINYGYS